MESGKIALILFLIVAILFVIAAGATPPSTDFHRSGNGTFKANSPVYTPQPTARPVQRAAASPSSGRRDVIPGPSTDGFYHPEDFYDWNRDDFSDYEEAEEYYYEHGGY